MNPVEFPYAGLILPDPAGLRPEDYLEAASIAVQRHAPREDGQVKRSKKNNAVLGADIGLKIRAEEDSAYGPRIIMEIVCREGEPAEDLASSILSDAVMIALEHSDADIVEWYSPDVLIDRDDFIRLRSYVSPRRTMDPSDVEELSMTSDFRSAIAQEQEEQPKESPGFAARISAVRARLLGVSPEDMRMGMASWAITGVLALVAFPLAVTLAIIGAVRGMDFRLATQALSVTALFAALENSHNVNTLIHQLFH